MSLAWSSVINHSGPESPPSDRYCLPGAPSCSSLSLSRLHTTVRPGICPVTCREETGCALGGKACKQSIPQACPYVQVDGQMRHVSCMSSSNSDTAYLSKRIRVADPTMNWGRSKALGSHGDAVQGSVKTNRPTVGLVLPSHRPQVCAR
jgi:hypothetical protein